MNYLRMTSRLLSLAASLALAASAFAAGDAFIEPADAGPDFAVQGEYVGDGCAAQVIALGDGKFHIVGWSKGLPGTSADVEKKAEVDAQRDGDKVVFNGDGWKGTIANGELNGTNDEGNSWKLKRTLRESPTAGAKPPAGALVLFDGSSADAWAGGKIDDRKLLQCGTKSKQTFADCTLHIEFRTPFMPLSRGQGRGNSGVYMQGRYELQVLDSFGLDGADNECGGIYSINKPIVNSCLPPLAWQTYDIEFIAAKYDGEKKVKNARCTIKHNGIVIHDDQELGKGTPGKDPEGPEANGLFLQDHGNPVAFRNIWVVEKK